MLRTAATSITVSERRTGATKRIAKRDIPFESLGLRRGRFIPGSLGLQVLPSEEYVASVSMPGPGYRERGHASREQRLQRVTSAFTLYIIWASTTVPYIVKFREILGGCPARADG